MSIVSYSDSNVSDDKDSAYSNLRLEREEATALSASFGFSVPLKKSQTSGSESVCVCSENGFWDFVPK